MRSRIFIVLMTVLALFVSSSALAHITQASDGWTAVFLHPFTGPGHLMMLAFLGVGVAYIVKKYRHSDE